MRMSVDVLEQAPISINTLKEREMRLRGLRIQHVENLGVTKDQCDTIDLSWNALVRLDNVPVLRRLTTLNLSHNRITRIDTGLGTQLPCLHTLLLDVNALSHLHDLDPLAALPLQRLSLRDNPVAAVPQYRLYVIFLLPRLKVLDYTRVSRDERDEAKRLFGAGSKTAEQKEALRQAILNATSVEEVEHLERLLGQ